MLPTVIIASVIAILFIAVISKGIKNKKEGRSSCSCGFACGDCSANCPSKIKK